MVCKKSFSETFIVGTSMVECYFDEANNLFAEIKSDNVTKRHRIMLVEQTGGLEYKFEDADVPEILLAIEKKISDYYISMFY